MSEVFRLSCPAVTYTRPRMAVGRECHHTDNLPDICFALFSQHFGRVGAPTGCPSDKVPGM